MEKIIDTHTHIMPYIDNGAKNIEEAYKILKEASKCGIESIILTPHYIPNMYETENYGREIWLKTLKSKFSDIDIKLYLASEIYLNKNIKYQIQKLMASTVNNTKYVLVSINEKTEMLDIYDYLEQLQRLNLKPIISHPERCRYIQKDPNILFDYIQKGAYVQLNYGSFIREYGYSVKKVAFEILDSNMVHFLGTDVHMEGSIYPRLNEAKNIITDKIGKQKFEVISYLNPKRMLLNKEIEVFEPKVVEYNLKEKISFFFTNISGKTLAKE